MLSWPAPTARSWRNALLNCLRKLFLVLVGLYLCLSPAARAEPAVVKVGVFISSISGISPADGSLKVASYVWARGPVGTFDLTQDLEILGRSASIKPIASTTLPDGSGYQAVLVEAVLNQHFDLRSYPFDRQTLLMQMESAKGTSKVILVPDTENSRIADFVRLPNWTINGLTLSKTDFTYETNFGYRSDRPTFSRLDIGIDVTRARSVLLLEKFTGFLVAMLLTGLVFLVPPGDLGNRVGITTGSIFAAVFNRYRLEDQIGFDASFGLVDQITFLTFSSIVMVLLIALYSFDLVEKRGVAAATRLDRQVGVAVMLVHGGLTAVAILVALI